jgi:hypothetical protein
MAFCNTFLTKNHNSNNKCAKQLTEKSRLKFFEKIKVLLIREGLFMCKVFAIDDALENKCLSFTSDEVFISRNQPLQRRRKLQPICHLLKRLFQDTGFSTTFYFLTLTVLLAASHI